VNLVVGGEHNVGVGNLLRVGPEQSGVRLEVGGKVMKKSESFVQEILLELEAGKLDAVAPRRARVLQELEQPEGTLGEAS